MTSVPQAMFIPHVPDSFSSGHDMLSGKGMNTYSICDAPLKRSVRRGTASLRYRNRTEITILMSEHKPHMIFVPVQSYPIQRGHMALGILQCEEEQSDKTIYYVACKTGVIWGALVAFAVRHASRSKQFFFSLFSFHMSRALRLRPQISEQTTISVFIVSCFLKRYLSNTPSILSNVYT